MGKMLKSLKENLVNPLVQGAGATLVSTLLIAGYPGNLLSQNIEDSRLEGKRKIGEMVRNNLYRERCFDKIDGYIHDAYNNRNKGPKWIPGYIKPEILKALIYVESSNNHKAVSKSGARGLGQIKHIAWREVEKEVDYHKGVFDPEKNTEVTLKYLVRIDSHLRKKYPNWNLLPNEKKLDMVLAAYNGGMGRLEKMSWDTEKMPKETQRYIKKIKNKLSENKI